MEEEKVKMFIGDEEIKGKGSWEIFSKELPSEQISFEGIIGGCNHSVKEILDFKIPKLILEDVELNIKQVCICKICGDLIFTVDNIKE